MPYRHVHGMCMECAWRVHGVLHGVRVALSAASSGFQDQVNSAFGMSMIVTLLAVLVLVVAIVGAVRQRAESARFAYRTVAVLPICFVFATAVVSASSDALSRLSATDAFWFKAAADQACWGSA